MTNTDDQKHRSILQGIANRAMLERGPRISKGVVANEC